MWFHSSEGDLSNSSNLTFQITASSTKHVIAVVSQCSTLQCVRPNTNRQFGYLTQTVNQIIQIPKVQSAAAWSTETAEQDCPGTLKVQFVMTVAIAEASVSTQKFCGTGT
jgi:hypothetical protein